MNDALDETSVKTADAQKLLARRLLQFGVPSFAAGASGALLMKVLGDINANRIDAQERAKAENPANTLVIRLPHGKLNTAKIGEVVADTLFDETERVAADQAQSPELLCFKTAYDLTPPSVKLAAKGDLGKWIGDAVTGRGPDSTEPVSWMFQAPIDAGTLAIPGLVGFHLLDSFFKEREKKHTRDSINKIKEDYSNLLLRDIQGSSVTPKGKPKTASCCVVDQLVDMATDALEDLSLVKTAGQKTAANLTGPYAASLPILVALLSGIASHNYALEKERELDAYYKSKAAPAFSGPNRIKLVSAAEPAIVKDSPKVEGEGKKAFATFLSPSGAMVGMNIMDRLSSGGPVRDERMTINIQPLEAEAAGVPTKPVIVLNDENSYKIQQEPGSEEEDILIEADDLEALKFLRANKQRLLAALT